MGIAGLLPFLEDAKREVNLEDLSGKRVAIDGHCWLHAAVGVNKDALLDGTTEPVYLGYIRYRLFQLLKHKIKPIIVFDGQSVPIKGVISEERKKIREQAKEKAEALKKENKLIEARKQLERTLKVTEDMIHKTIELLDQFRIQHIIAPFEADPQLAYLNLTGQVDAIFSVDSDLLVFGCKQVIFPKKSSLGKGYYSISQQDIFKIEETPDEDASPRRVFIDLTDYNTTKLRHVCILSGCDYLKSLPKVGLKTAFSALNKTNHDVEKTIRELCKSKMRMGTDIDAYLKGFRNANAGFLYQHVFDPRTRMYTRLNPLPESIDFDIDVLGESPVDKDIPLLRSNRAIIVSQEEERIIQTEETTILESITGKLESLHIKQTSSATSTTKSTKLSSSSTFLSIEEHHNHHNHHHHHHNHYHHGNTTTNDEDGSLTVPSNDDGDHDTVSSSQEGYYRLTNDEQSQWDELADQLESLYIKSTMETAKERVIVGGDGDGSIDESFVAATTTTSTSASTHFKVKEKEVETTTSL